MKLPNKPKRPCRYKNCPNLTDSKSGYCELHEKAARKDYDKFLRPYDANKRYGYKWRKLRTRFLNHNPLCEMCKEQGRYTQATEVHHIKPLSEGGDNTENNLMALCHSCHSRITMTTINRGRG